MDAPALGVEAALQRGGVEAARPWYSKLRVNGRTLLRVRPDVVQVIKEAVTNKAVTTEKQ